MGNKPVLGFMLSVIDKFYEVMEQVERLGKRAPKGVMSNDRAIPSPPDGQP